MVAAKVTEFLHATNSFAKTIFFYEDIDHVLFNFFATMEGKCVESHKPTISSVEMDGLSFKRKEDPYPFFR